MFNLFAKKDAAESFIWSDGRFEAVSYSHEKRVLAIDFTDYCSNRFRFTFFGVDRFIATDPVYCIHSSHQKHEGKKKLELSDDDGVVVSFVYETVERHQVSV